MVNAGRILIVPKGIWSSLTSYEMLDLVTQDGVAYIARQANVGVQPKTDSQYTYWQPFGNAAEPDNETIVYNANNRYTVNLDGKTLVYDGDEGCITVAIDGTTIKFDEDEGYLYAEVKSNLADLLDVVLTTPANGQVLTYNAVTGKWVNANPTGGMQAHLVITSEAGSVVTVTTPSGSIITATQVTGSTTQWECDTQEYGVHTVDAVLLGDDAQITVMVDACKIYNIDDSHIHANITVTFPAGLTCRCQGQGENYYANSNPYTFSVHHLGEYTITATDNGSTTYTETVEITESAQSESIFCPSTENAPTDDIQMWLMFAGILDKNYTTLSEVLADNTTLSALIADNNAVDYMVRSKTWISNGLVPKMTSNTTPSGVASADSEYSSTYAAYKSFDGDTSSYWSPSNGTTTKWLQYMFANEVRIVKWSCIWDTFNLTSIQDSISSVTLQGSNDGFVSDTHNIDTVNTADMTSNSLIRTVSVNAGYAYFRISFAKKVNSNATPSRVQFYAYDGNGITEDSTAMTYIGLNNYCANTLLADSDWLTAICNSAYFESVLNAKVPVMTDDTHPSGEASADKPLETGYGAYRAFDGNSNTDVVLNPSLAVGGIIYKFTSAVKVRLFRWLASLAVADETTLKVYYSDDGINYTAETETYTYLTSDNGTNKDFIIPDYGAHLYWKVERTRTVGGVICNTLQFWGRVDV